VYFNVKATALGQLPTAPESRLQSRACSPPNACAERARCSDVHAQES